MRILTTILLLLSLTTQAQWKVSFTPTNLAFNCLTIGVESRNGWEVVTGLPFKMSLTYPFERFGIQRSDYDRSNMGIASLLIGHKSYVGSFYVEPYMAVRWINLNWHINPKPNWPVNSTFRSDISTSNLGLSFGKEIKLTDKFYLNIFAGPELCLLNNIRTSSKSISIEDRDWMYDYYIPHEYKEAFPYRLYSKLFERKDGYDVYACVRNVWFWSVRGGIGIIFKL